jgi:signal peptidase
MTARADEEDERSLGFHLRRGLAGGLLALTALVALLVVVIPIVTGARAYTITTGSMWPAMPPGTLVVVRHADPDSVRTGDVITFQLESGQPAVATHRVVGRALEADGTAAFVTRGDANNVDDADPVLPAQVVGRVWYSIPYLGRVNQVLTGSVRARLVPVVVLLLFGYGAWMLVSAARDRRRSKLSR